MEQRKAPGEPPTAAVQGVVRKESELEESGDASAPPAAKRFKPIPLTESLKEETMARGERTPAMVTEPESKLAAAAKVHRDVHGGRPQRSHRQHGGSDLDRKPPASVVGGADTHTTGPMSPASDISSGSSSHHKSDVASHLDSGYVQEVPPAPPSTPASNQNTASLLDPGLATPLPIRDSVLNAFQLERQQMLSEGGITPAPKSDSSVGARPVSLTEDFSEWAVGDRYEMIRILGKGSYGEVAQAVDKYAGHPDAYVAIKRILSPFDQEIDAIRLYREIHILRRLRGHSCIINLLDIVQPPTDDLDDFHDLYLVFEYVDTDLYKLIMSPQYLTTEHIQTFLYQMLTGLKYIHSFSVIHRDLKPANILLNEDCSLKVCDFGLARIVNCTQAEDDNSIDSNADSQDPHRNPLSLGVPPPKRGLTRQLTKHVVTRWYRAPELILIQPYTSAVDIWSLGCILAELLSMQEGSVAGYQDRKPLFPGGTCYPLSGDLDKIKNEERLDQLSVIFGVIGTPSQEDIASIGNAHEYIMSMEKTKGRPLEKIYSAADPLAIDLLKKMLQFNPKSRCTAQEALEHDFFKGVRRKDMEPAASEPLIGPAFLENNQIDLLTLKRKTFEEVRWYRDAVVSAERKAVDSDQE
ncbi:Mitogen-activated protein kinase HOG1 (Fragment) [Seminavis robusta]|uniref:Mitogen-activated protein kinase n=1 Tax=Seminavis robusta TaxID=568900 RepID=A0A9N8HNK4_9STRA